jgi:O-6-methylguanine DNA methyltransferase|tara:strand:- start:551 stop:997 length:447 start_codon:yes stop_codon:yes gene_type:complete
MINQISTKTRFGWITAFENHGKIFKIKFGRSKKQTKNKTLENFKKELLKFFNKKISNIKTPHKMVGNPIQKKIWSELKKTKFGHTTTYGKISKKYKLSPRHVGKICGQNNLLLIIPCHRVIRNDGSLGGFTSIGGIKLKKKLLEFEKT